MSDYLDTVDPTISIDGAPFRVLGYVVREALSEISTLTCEVIEDDVETKNPAALIGMRAEFSLERSEMGDERTFVGQIVRAERHPDNNDVRTLRLIVAPVPWVLTKRHDCRVFQNLSVVDIAKEVLSAAAIPDDKQDWQIAGTHNEREYLVQYRETDFDFLQRILSEEGIYWAVHFVDGNDVIQFSDKPNGTGEIDATPLPHYDIMGGIDKMECVTRVTQRLTVAPDKASLRDYNYENPAAKVEATLESTDEGEHALEVYDYPARCTETADAERLAQVLLDELQARRTTVEGYTGVLGMKVGLRFTIEEHPYSPLNQEYTIIGVDIEGNTPRIDATVEYRSKYSCRFTAIPSANTCAPPRRARAADIVGLQTTFTTGPPGEEIHVNEAGEVTIRYHWDRLGTDDEKSSLPVRTRQAQNGDSMLLPRMKWEVATTHLEGDPDQPLVMARMYNGTTPPPYNLPEECSMSSLQTATTPGGGSVNEMRMGDSAGAEEMYFNASKDMTVDVKNNTTESVGNNHTHSIGSNHSKNVTNSSTISVGSNQTVKVGGNQEISVETRMQDEVAGDHTLDIGGNRDMKVGGDHKRDVGGDSKHEVGGRRIDLVVGSVTDDTLGAYQHDVGAALIDVTVNDRSLQVKGSISETAGAAKIIYAKGGRGVEVGTTMTQKVAGAIINLATDRVEKAKGTYTEIAAGAHLVKSKNITVEADTVLTIVMGASTLTLLPALVAIAGISVKLDGDVSDLAVLVIDN